MSIMFPILTYRHQLCSRYCLIDLKYVPDNLTDTSCVTDIVLIGYVPVVVLSISIMFPTFLLISVMYLILSYRFKLCSRYSYWYRLCSWYCLIRYFPVLFLSIYIIYPIFLSISVMFLTFSFRYYIPNIVLSLSVVFQFVSSIRRY